MTYRDAIDAVLIGFFLCSIVSNGIIFHLLRASHRFSNHPRQLAGDRYLCVVLRVFKEEAMVTATIAYIADRIHGLRNVSVIVVGTARERDRQGRNPTLELARAAARDQPGVTVIEAEDKIGGTHAHQTNVALRSITTDPKTTWFFVVDIDSRFSKAGLQAAIDAINADVQVAQQHALFLSNFPSLPFAQRAHALYQSCWTIRHEMKRVFLSNETGLSVAHVAGHGLCMNLQKLRDYGELPEETPFEDIALGFYLVASRERIVSLPVFELGDTPATLDAGLRQEFSWSYAAMLYPSYLGHYRRRFPGLFRIHRSRAVLLAATGTWGYVRWLLGSWFSVALMAAALCGHVLAIACCAAIALEYAQCAVALTRFGGLSKSDLAKMPAHVAVGILRRSLPADAAFIAWAARGVVTKHKTPHV